MKRLLILATSCAMASAAFAQNAKSAGITDADVKSWAKNYKQIQNEFSDAGISLDEAGFSRDDIATTSKQDKAKAETILQKYGIAAPNRLNKLAMINQCASLVMAEANIDANTMATLKQMGVDPFAELKQNTNQKDCKVVKANEKAVIAAMNGIDDSAGNATAASTTAGAAQAGGSPSTNASAINAGNSNGIPKDYAESIVAQMRASDPSMTDEDAEIMAQTMRKQPSYAMQQAQWESQQRAVADEAQKSAQAADAEYKQIEETAVKFQNAIEEFSKSKGDCGLIYKKMDKASAAKYVKKAPQEWETLMIRVDSDVLALISIKDRKKVELTFDWEEPKITKMAIGGTGYAASNVETTETSKSIPITITNIELYETSDKSSTAREYVISTKEGKVIHLWQKWDNEKVTSSVNFNGLKNASSWSWGETGGN